MLYGVPIITSDVGGNHEILDENRCVFIKYDGIKDFENNNFYINNYLEQLNILGYYVLNNNNINKIKTNYDKRYLEVIPPIFIESDDEGIKNIIKEKNIIWQNNVDKIYQCFEKMININKKDMIKNNKIFLNNYFNEQIYFDTLLKIL